MNDTNEPANTERVPGFVYLDMERVKSISSRLDEGYIMEKVEEREKSSEVAKSITGSIKASIFGIVPGVATGKVESSGSKTDASINISGENKALHHYYFTLLEEWLEGFQGDWFHDISNIKENFQDHSYSDAALPSKVRTEIAEGDIIRITCDLQLLDFEASIELMNGFFKAIDDLEALSENISDPNDKSEIFEPSEVREMLQITEEMNDLKSIEPMFDFFENILPAAYDELLAAEAYPYENSTEKIWALLQEENLESKPVELLSKYQRSTIPNCTLIARVDTITEEMEEQAEDDEFNFGTFHHISDDLASDFGLKVRHPAISVSPIAIYR